MFKLVKWLLTFAFVTTLAAGASYAAAFFEVGKLVGSNPPLSERTAAFSLLGVPETKGEPLTWIFTYQSTRLRGVRRAKIIVSATGKVLATTPPDLTRRLEAWEKSLLR